jgi:hypothetical protein
MIRALAVAALGLVAAVVAIGRRIRPGDLVGKDHPSGELRLRLDADGCFSLRLAVWDAVVGDLVDGRELRGGWRQRFGELELRAAGRLIVYARASDPTGGWIWRRSSLPTFADGIALIPERRTVSPLATGLDRRQRTLT